MTRRRPPIEPPPAPEPQPQLQQRLVPYRRRPRMEVAERLEPSPLVLRLGPEAQAQVTAQELEQAAERLRSSRSSNTRRAYASAWQAFEAWCIERGAQPLPASGSTVSLYLSHLASLGRKPSTIDVVLAAIAKAHETGGHPSPRHEPIVREMRSGIRRQLGVRPREAKALERPELLAVLGGIDGGEIIDLRDRALLLVGWCSALRRSSLVALDVDHLEWRDEGLVLRVGREKQDQEGQGREIPIPFSRRSDRCPVRALQAWLEEAGITAGPVFCSVSRWGHLGARLDAGDVARIIKRRAEDVGADGVELLSGHSLRAGFATTAIKAGRPTALVMKQTGHKSAAVFERYVRTAELFDAPAGAGLLD